jgi:hypothetical protein
MRDLKRSWDKGANVPRVEWVVVGLEFAELDAASGAMAAVVGCKDAAASLSNSVANDRGDRNAHNNRALMMDDIFMYAP